MEDLSVSGQAMQKVTFVYEMELLRILARYLGITIEV